MTEKIHDLMIERTRQLIKDTLLLLLEEKSFFNVTVSDLTQKAKINRGTFYLHYQDKYDLIDQVESELMCGLERSMQRLNSQDMLKCYMENTPYIPLVQVFQYLKQNGHILKRLLGSNGDPAFSLKMKSFLKDSFFADLIESFEDPSIPVDYFSSYAVSAYLGIIENWLSNELSQSPEEMAMIYVKIKMYGTKLLKLIP
jgi:AcrR family transcriptional regulator